MYLGAKRRYINTIPFLSFSFTEPPVTDDHGTFDDLRLRTRYIGKLADKLIPKSDLAENRRDAAAVAGE